MQNNIPADFSKLRLQNPQTFRLSLRINIVGYADFSLEVCKHYLQSLFCKRSIIHNSNFLPDFTYTAITKAGQRVSATIQAANIQAAGHALKEQGLLPLDIGPLKKVSVWTFLKSITTISLDEKIGFVENLSIMLKSGIPLTRAMQILVKQTKNARFNAIILDIASQVEGGKSLAEALGKHSNVFSNIFISMVKVGELSGNLDKSLEYLTLQLHREADLKSKVRGAMIYPSVIVAAMVIIAILMSIFVLPKLTSIFKEFGNVDLPFMTKVVIAVADFMSAHSIVMVGLIIACVFGVVLFYRTYQGKKAFDFISVRIFIIGTIIRKINLARFARILSSLLKSGIPIVEGLEVAGNSIANIPYRELIIKAASEVRLGKNLTETLSKDDTLFPVLVVQMLEVGEESGTVEDMLGQLAVHYEEEVDTIMKNLSSIIEPLLLLFIGGIVGVLAVALISPIYSISQSIK
ncbi:MAG: type II secretion system F family protein [Candidatus Doudnabacteria bacterium]|nr:type II secretion system F family protein [Candidatus Doudnabacteria bacterium]